MSATRAEGSAISSISAIGNAYHRTHSQTSFPSHGSAPTGGTGSCAKCAPTSARERPVGGKVPLRRQEGRGPCGESAVTRRCWALPAAFLPTTMAPMPAGEHVLGRRAARVVERPAVLVCPPHLV